MFVRAFSSCAVSITTTERTHNVQLQNTAVSPQTLLEVVKYVVQTNS
jgi:hypothetical protein